jgi:penicillin amidase
MMSRSRWVGGLERKLWRALFRAALGRRLPIAEGVIETPHAKAPVRIGRDAHGVAYITAGDDADAWFGLGFCQGQDRGFQLEGLLRLVRGTLAEIVGEPGVPIDRVARRLGFRRAAVRQIGNLEPRVREALEAFARGVTEGVLRGTRRRPHELALLRAAPTPYEAADVLGVSKALGLLLSANWDLELARLEILVEDGPEALADLHPDFAREPPLVLPPGASVRPALDSLSADLLALVGGGGSNSWAIAGSRTASGRPLVANDVHLEPVLPSSFYLARVAAPGWAVAGAALAGTPVMVVGHNGALSWGVTAGLVDNTDLFIEEVGSDGRSVRGPHGFEPCDTFREVIAVRGREPLTERVLVTPRGPIVGSALEQSPIAISLSATWLEPRPMVGLFEAYRARSCAELRAALRAWPSVSLNVVGADSAGSIAWQLAGDVPLRRKGLGTVCRAAWDPDSGWEPSPVAFEALPHAVDPPTGFVASANNEPTSSTGAFLGADWIDGYRMARITEALGARADWDVEAAAALQLDLESLPWRELRPFLLEAPVADPDARRGRGLLSSWDGVVSPTSTGAAVFEVFLSELAGRVVEAKAARAAGPRPAGRAPPLARFSAMGMRPVERLVELLRTQPEGWFERPWPDEIADALGSAVRRLRASHGDSPERWSWGRVRPLRLRHPLGRRAPLQHVFDLGPIGWGGDANTISQAATPPLVPTGNPLFVATLRMVVEVGAWDEASFVVAGGQSGNPVSPYYADQVPLWRRGRGLAIAWSPERVAEAVTTTLELRPPHEREAARAAD